MKLEVVTKDIANKAGYSSSCVRMCDEICLAFCHLKDFPYYIFPVFVRQEIQQHLLRRQQKLLLTAPDEKR